MIRAFACILSFGLLAGCAATAAPEPVIRTVEVVVPVPVSCIPESLGGPEAYADDAAALLAAPDGAERYRLLTIGRSQRIDRLDKLEAVVRLCAEIPHE